MHLRRRLRGSSNFQKWTSINFLWNKKAQNFLLFNHELLKIFQLLIRTLKISFWLLLQVRSRLKYTRILLKRINDKRFLLILTRYLEDRQEGINELPLKLKGSRKSVFLRVLIKLLLRILDLTSSSTHDNNPIENQFDNRETINQFLKNREDLIRNYWNDLDLLPLLAHQHDQVLAWRKRISGLPHSKVLEVHPLGSILKEA